jgi:hypothetical protein
MSFNKATMQEQLGLFVRGFAASVDRVLLSTLSDDMHEIERVKKTTLWQVTDAFYEYGINGVPCDGLGAGQVIDGEFADIELFLNHIEYLDSYLCEDSVVLPHFAKTAARTAIARHVLEGGERYSLSSEDEEGYLGLAEIALLAKMDEKSVRNAANSKNNDPLKTETIGKRSMVSVAEARRWLAGRKGYVSTQATVNNPNELFVNLNLPKSLAETLKQKAEESGLSVADFLGQQLASKYR